MSPWIWIGGLVGSAYVWKKKPEWIPAPLRPKSAAKRIAALGRVTATSVPTPSHTAGLDPDMPMAEIAAANGLLATSTDSAACYQMASDYSEKGYKKTAEALIHKADALVSAKSHGADDDALYSQMIASSGGGSTATSVAAQNVPGIGRMGPNFG